jgi:hypothetical protein
LESSLPGLQDWFRPRCDPRSGRGVMAIQSPGSPTGTHSEQFRDSISGVPGKCDIWMPLPWSNAEYTIRSKVVAYSRGPGRGVSCGPKCPWLVATPKGVPERELTTLWFVLDANSSLIYCRTPTLAKYGGEAQHLEKSRVGVLRDSRVFRAR